MNKKLYIHYFDMYGDETILPIDNNDFSLELVGGKKHFLFASDRWQYAVPFERFIKIESK